MREITFRAWDKKALKMSPSFALFGEFILLGAFHDWQHEIGNTAKTSLEALGDLEVMQYTGLKDKNAKEIYEGDIITCHTNNQFKYPHKGTVVFLEHTAGFAITTEPIVNQETGIEEEAVTFFHYNENFEVIGNVYEPPKP